MRERELLERRYTNKLREALWLRQKVTYALNKRIPFLRLFRYKEAFSYQLVKELLHSFGFHPSKDLLIDPFCGMGTAPFTAGTLGLRAIGIDKLPLAVFLSKTLSELPTKSLEWLPDTIAEMQKSLSHLSPAPIADLPIISKAFEPTALLELRKMKSFILEARPEQRQVLLFLLLACLEECSYTSKDGQFLRICKTKRPSRPMEALIKKVKVLLEDVNKAQKLRLFKDFRKPEFYLADAREISQFNIEASILITSPPYVNRYDYSRIYILELAFAFAKDAEDIKKIRHSLIRSHIEAKVKEEPPPHPALEEVLKALANKKLNNPKIPDMLLGYFVDMAKVISEWSKILRRGAKVAIVVDNVRFMGEVVPVDLILSDLAQENGFETECILVARYKGNSSQQMARYGKVPVRESILIWRKL